MTDSYDLLFPGRIAPNELISDAAFGMATK